MENYEGRLGEAGEQIRRDAKEWANEAAAQGRGLFEDQKRIFAEQVAGMADALHTTAQRLHEERQESAAHYADWAASGLARAAGNLRENDLRKLVHGAERFAWKNPVLFMGGAIAAGFFLSRLLKSSAQRERYEVEEEPMQPGDIQPGGVRGADYEPTERMGTDI